MRKKIYTLLLVAALLMTGLLSACQNKRLAESLDDRYLSVYEIFVYSFADSDGDGIGDFKGLTKRLDYINDGNPKTETDLGFNGIWLMPISPSPTYHKYDVTDYKAIDPEYGTMDDFKAFLTACEKRGIKVIIDLVLNHSSSEHPWFIEATVALAKDELDNKYIDYYYFSQEKKSDKYYPVPGADGWFYEAVFWDQMPDLALDNEQLRAEIQDIMKFWLDLGVYGFRLDAVTQYYTGNDEQNIAFLTWLSEAGKSINKDAYFVAEAWTNEATYTKYYQSGIDSFFDFAAADSLGQIATAINSSDASALMQHFAKIQSDITAINPNAMNAAFLSNHDMGRSVGYFAADLGKMKLAAATYLLSSGTSFTYYGEEIGIRGSGRDENKRSPMLWLPESNPDKGDQTLGPIDMEKDKISYPFGSVEEQTKDPNSLLNFYITTLKTKNKFPIIARGATEFVQVSGDKAVAALSKANNEKEELLLVYNFASEDRNVDLAANYANAKLAATLSEFGEAEFGKGVWILPAYSVTIFTLN